MESITLTRPQLLRMMASDYKKEDIPTVMKAYGKLTFEQLADKWLTHEKRLEKIDNKYKLTHIPYPTSFYREAWVSLDKKQRQVF